MHRKASRKTHSTNSVNIESRVRKTLCEHVNCCAQPDGSRSSLLQSTGSSPYVLVHIVGPLAATLDSHHHLKRHSHNPVIAFEKLRINTQARNRGTKSPSGKICWTLFKTIEHGLKNLGPSQKTFRPA